MAEAPACTRASSPAPGYARSPTGKRRSSGPGQARTRRADYQYEAGLSFEDFVFKYFEVYKKVVPVDDRELVLMLFHMRSLSPDGHLITVPAVGDYWHTRAELFRQNPWLNRGCVFLSHQVKSWPHDDGDASRRCILHAPFSESRITTKPVDCVFFTCDRPIEARVPTEEQSSAWFRLLAENFPNSLERFEELIGLRAKNHNGGDDEER